LKPKKDLSDLIATQLIGPTLCNS